MNVSSVRFALKTMNARSPAGILFACVLYQVLDGVREKLLEIGFAPSLEPSMATTNLFSPRRRRAIRSSRRTSATESTRGTSSICTGLAASKCPRAGVCARRRVSHGRPRLSPLVYSNISTYFARHGYWQSARPTGSLLWPRGRPAPRTCAPSSIGSGRTPAPTEATPIVCS